MQQWVYAIKTFENAWGKFERDISDDASDQWRDRLRSCVRADDGHFALKWMFIYMIHQSILWDCQCNLMHLTALS